MVEFDEGPWPGGLTDILAYFAESRACVEVPMLLVTESHFTFTAVRKGLNDDRGLATVSLEISSLDDESNIIVRT